MPTPKAVHWINFSITLVAGLACVIASRDVARNALKIKNETTHDLG